MATGNLITSSSLMVARLEIRVIRFARERAIWVRKVHDDDRWRILLRLVRKKGELVENYSSRDIGSAFISTLCITHLLDLLIQ